MIIKRQGKEGPRYVARTDWPRQNGKRRRTQTTHATLREAEKAERAAESQRDKGDVCPEKVSVEEVVERYIRTKIGLKKLGLKASEGYRQLLRDWIAPAIGSLPVSKLRSEHVEDLQIAILEKRSTKTAKHVLALLSAALKKVKNHVCDEVEPPTPDQAEAKALDPEEIDRLIAVATGSRLEGFIRLALVTGCRRGELCALTWADVVNGIATIRASLSETKSVGVYRKNTKTNKVRKVPLGSSALEVLRRQRVQQMEDRLRAGECYQGTPGAADHPVFADEIGRQLTPANVTNGFRRLAKRAGISTTRLHDLRHTAASNLIAEGIDAKTTADIIGHSSISLTLDRYAHAFEPVKRAAIDRLDERLGLGGAKKGGRSSG